MRAGVKFKTARLEGERSRALLPQRKHYSTAHTDIVLYTHSGAGVTDLDTGEIVVLLPSLTNLRHTEDCTVVAVLGLGQAFMQS